MRIEVSLNGTDFYINTGESTYDLVRLGRNETVGSKGYGEITEKPIGYYSSFAKCVDSIIKSSLSTTDQAVSLKEFVEIFEKGRKELVGLID